MPGGDGRRGARDPATDASAADLRRMRILAEWEAERARHPFFAEALAENSISACWDRSAEDYDGSGYGRIRRSMIDDLVVMGVLDGDRTVIDIGCGPGLFLKELAERSGKVYCVDSSVPMIDKVEQLIGSEGIVNAETILASWERLEPVYGTDIAFTSLCPPMNDPESLLRMEDFASCRCVYASSANDDTGITADVWKRLGKAYTMKGYDTGYPYGFLKACGRRPELRYYSERTVIEQTAEEAVSATLRAVSGYLGTGAEVEDAVRDAVLPYTEDGTVRIEKDMRIGMLVWEPLR